MWPNCCCCPDCGYVKITHTCCTCIPEQVCYLFYYDDEFTAPFDLKWTHDTDGHYTPIQLPSSTNWVGLELEENGSGNCVWRVWTANNSSGTSPSQEVETLLTVDNVGCLTDIDSQISIPSWVHEGSGGTLYLHPVLKTAIPKDNGAAICTGCDCFSSCVCLGYLVTFYQDDERNPGELEKIGNVFQFERTCWDKDKGDHGGWEFSFPGTDCTPAETVLIELEDDGAGACELVLTDNTQFTRASSTTGTTDCTTDFSDVIWKYWPDAYTEVQYTITQSDCEENCERPCCEALPDTLTALVEFEEEINGPHEITLTRVNCTSSVYTGTGQVEWNCASEGTSGYGDVSMTIVCNLCEYNYVEGDCDCDCDETSTSFSETGCWTMSGFTTANFECYNPVDCSYGSIGSLSGSQASNCGYDSAVPITYYSECVPILQMWRITDPAGIGGCFDRWNVTVTE